MKIIPTQRTFQDGQIIWETMSVTSCWLAYRGETLEVSKPPASEQSQRFSYESQSRSHSNIGCVECPYDTRPHLFHTRLVVSSVECHEPPVPKIKQHRFRFGRTGKNSSPSLGSAENPILNREVKLHDLCFVPCLVYSVL
jgi:hypothetical protein